MRIPRGGFQRWPRSAQAGFVQFVLLLGIALGALAGPVAFAFASVAFTLTWTLFLLKRRAGRNHR